MKGINVDLLAFVGRVANSSNVDPLIKVEAEMILSVVDDDVVGPGIPTKQCNQCGDPIFFVLNLKNGWTPTIPLGIISAHSMLDGYSISPDSHVVPHNGLVWFSHRLICGWVAENKGLPFLSKLWRLTSRNGLDGSDVTRALAALDAMID